MKDATEPPWAQAMDDALVERLIGAMQRAVVEALGGAERGGGDLTLPAPETATALLNLLASVLESAPECGTPMGMRKLSDAAGRHLLVLMRGYRDLGRAAATAAIH